MVSPGKPTSALERWAAQPHTRKGWPQTGIWKLAGTVPVFVIVCRELPIVPETLLFRLMGDKATLSHALLEVARTREPWVTPYIEMLVRRKVMVTQPGYQPDDNDEDFKRQFEKVADDFITSLRQEGREEGRDEGRGEGREEVAMALLPRMLQLRLGRALTSAELAHLHASIAVTPSEELADRILTDSPERLSAWLESV